MGTDTSKSLFNQAMKEIMASNYVAAELMLAQAAELNEENTTLYAASLAVLMAYRDRADEAVAMLEERLEAQSTDPNLLLAYGLTLEKHGKDEDAEDAFKEVLAQDPDNAGALRGMSARLRARGELEEAARLAVKAFTQCPDNLVFAKTASDLLEATDRAEAALEVLELGAHYNPEDEELVCRALSGLVQRSQRERCKELLDLLDETQGWAAAWKIALLDWLGMSDRSEALLARTLERPTAKEATFCYQAALHALRRENPAAADAHLDRLLLKEPQNPAALRLKAELAAGRSYYDVSIDPIMRALGLEESDTTPWQDYWSGLATDQFEEVEELLASIADDEEALQQAGEGARLELAEALLLAQQGVETEPGLGQLETLPEDLAAGILLEFLEGAQELGLHDTEAAWLYDRWVEELGRIDSILNLNRLYAQEDFPRLRSSLDRLLTLLEDPASSADPLSVGSIYRLYDLLWRLATDQPEEEDRSPDREVVQAALEILTQRPERNASEQRWYDANNVTLVSENPDLVPSGAPRDPGTPPLAGQYLDVAEEYEVVYETEDGQILEGLKEGEYEVIEEIIEEIEVDPDDEDYEWVWVEEEIEVDAPPGGPEDTYQN